MPIRKKYLIFDSHIGSNKPENIINKDAMCPFCCREQLADIIEREGSILLIKNKYPVLLNTLQTILIETDECSSELSTYPKEHLYKVIRFGITKWQEMIDSGEYASVIFYKNYGPCSGGTIRHPHMQIVGLYDVDYTENISVEHFEGEIIDKRDGIELNLAKQPNNGFFEFNIRLAHLQQIDQMADYIQIVTHYLLHHFHKGCNSYNLFFYQIEGEIMVKVIPRFIVSPLVVGYSIPYVFNRIREIVKEVQDIYFIK